MLKKIMLMVWRNRVNYQFELMFGTDWKENTKDKR